MRHQSLFMAALLLAGCAIEVDPSERPLFWNGSNTLTALLFDGQTAAPIENATVQVRVGADLLDAKRDGNVYTVAQIPPGTHLVQIRAAGYLDFIASQAFSNTAQLGNPNATITFVTRTAAMFPAESVPDDLTVKVYESGSGAPVQSGTLVATLDAAQLPVLPTGALADPLPGTFGFMPRVVTVDLLRGVAVFPKANLILGASYKLHVLSAKDADGRFLASELATASIRPGFDANELLLFVGPPAVVPVALSANNETAGAKSKELVVKFPYPVVVCSKSSEMGWTNETPGSADTNDDGIITAPAAKDSVRVTLEEAGTVLSLGYKSAVEDLEDSLQVEFRGVRVQVASGVTNPCVELEKVKLRDSAATVSTRITVRDLPVSDPAGSGD